MWRIPVGQGFMLQTLEEHRSVHGLLPKPDVPIAGPALGQATGDSGCLLRWAFFRECYGEVVTFDPGANSKQHMGAGQETT